MQQVGGSMVVCSFISFFHIDNSIECSFRIFRKLFGKVNNEVIFLFGIKNLHLVAFIYDISCITSLPAGFAIERSLVENKLVVGFVFLSDFSVPCYPGLCFGLVVTKENCLIGFSYFHPVACIKLCSIARAA